MLRYILMLQTVPLDCTGVQPKPRQARAIFGVRPLFLSLSLAAPPFCRQPPCHLLLRNTTSFPPSELPAAFLRTSSIQTDSICRRQPPPPHPPAPLCLQLTRYKKKRVFFLSRTPDESHYNKEEEQQSQVLISNSNRAPFSNLMSKMCPVRPRPMVDPA